MQNCENYTILLNWLNNKYSEEELFYISLKNNDFSVIQKCFEQIKETLKEFPSFVFDFTKEEDVYAVRLINNKYCYEKIQINDIIISSISLGKIDSERYITLFKKNIFIQTL